MHRNPTLLVRAVKFERSISRLEGEMKILLFPFYESNQVETGANKNTGSQKAQLPNCRHGLICLVGHPPSSHPGGIYSDTEWASVRYGRCQLCWELGLHQ